MTNVMGTPALSASHHHARAVSVARTSAGAGPATCIASTIPIRVTVMQNTPAPRACVARSMDTAVRGLLIAEYHPTRIPSQTRTGLVIKPTPAQKDSAALHGALRSGAGLLQSASRTIPTETAHATRSTLAPKGIVALPGAFAVRGRRIVARERSPANITLSDKLTIMVPGWLVSFSLTSAFGALLKSFILVFSFLVGVCSCS